MAIQAAHNRDHGGRIDAAIAHYGGTRKNWIDLSTGIAPTAYPLPAMTAEDWTALPDSGAQDALIDAARRFWNVPDTADILPVPGASVAIAQLPRLLPHGTVRISGPTYNEHAAAFETHEWTVSEAGACTAKVMVHPNNPTGHLWQPADVESDLCIVDESFCDVTPDQTMVPALANQPSLVILKSFGKFWGLAGLRLGFVIAAPDRIAHLRNWIGPWAVSGPALRVGAHALNNPDWADAQRARLQTAADRLDRAFVPHHAELVGGTSLFRLYETPNAQELYTRLAQAHILTRTFPYNSNWIRVGLPPEDAWDRLESVL